MTHSPITTDARVLDGDNPFGVDPAADQFAVPLVERELWSETMLFVAWSDEDEVGVWVHLGVDLQDKTLWWVHTFAFLPDGVVLADRSFARLRDGRGNLRVTCVEPLKRWTLAFDGAGEASSTDQLAAAPLGLRIPVPFQFEVDFDAVGPIYDMHAAMGQQIDWQMGGLHHEQGCRVTGKLTSQGTSWQLNGAGIRDHSVGERSFAGHGGHVWNLAVWPKSRRVLSVFTMWRPPDDAVALSMVMLMESGTTEITHHFDMTGKTASGGVPRELELHFLRADGTPVDIVGRIVHNATATFAEPNDNLIGNHGGSDDGFENPIVADESMVRWVWHDGEIGFGNVESAFRPSMLPSPQIPLPTNSPFIETRKRLR